jgi:putative transposase
MKAYTSKELKQSFKFIQKIYKHNMWSTGYFVSSVGLNEEQIKKYITSQNQYDTGIDASQEFE